jgi:hypothetical protein
MVGICPCVLLIFVLVIPIPPEGRHPTKAALQPDPETLGQNPCPVKLDNTVVTLHSRPSQDNLEVITLPEACDPGKSRIQELDTVKTCQWEVIGDKLTQAGYRSKQFKNYERCGQEEVYVTCKQCGDWKTVAYQCSIKWCPRCNWKITRRRQEELRVWAKTIAQPKHVVTTQRNTTSLTRSMLKEHIKRLSRLRRTQVFRQVQGGCVSVEITNEKRGWHLHAHWLLDAKWIDVKELAVTWGRIVGQDYAIVKVCDLRHREDYEKEITKYVVKGSEMAKWPAREIREFVEAVRGSRFFMRFGTLFKMKHTRPPRETRICACGCGEFVVTTELGDVLKQTRRRGR